MPHPVRGNQATTTPPHQPSPPHPTPTGETPLAAQRPPPRRLPTPRWVPGVGAAGAQAGQSRSRRSLGGAPVPACPPTTRACHLPPPTARLWAAGPGAFRCSRLLSAAPRHPLPPCARLTGGAWAAGGSGWRSRPPGRPAAGRAGRDLPAPGPCWCLWATPAAAAFLRLFQLFVAALH